MVDSGRWPLLMRKSTAAEILDVSPRTVERMMAANRIKWVRLPGVSNALRIRRSDIESLVEALEHEGPQPDVNRKRAAEA